MPLERPNTPTMMETPNTERRVIVALIALLLCVFAVLLGVQRHAHEAIGHDAAVQDLDRGRQLLEHLLALRRDQLLSDAALVAERLGRAADLDALALTREFEGRAVDFALIVDREGRVRTVTLPQPPELERSELPWELGATVQGRPGQVTTFAVLPLGDARLVAAQVLDAAALRRLSSLLDLELALVADEPGHPRTCLVSTFGCADVEAGTTTGQLTHGGDWHSQQGARLHPDAAISLVVARASDAALAPFRLLDRTSMQLALVAVAVAILGIAFVTTRLVRPLHAMAYQDELTGLANRALLSRHLEAQCQRAAESGTPMAVMMMDLDRFKNINDTLGHDAGDRVLAAVGQRLHETLRTSDIIARQGGDEFVVLLPGTEPRFVDAVAAKISAALETPIQTDGQTIDVSASIGYAIAPEDGETPRDLLRMADTAMFAAKRERRPFLRWSAGCDTAKASELSLLGEMRVALEADQFELHFQPLIGLPSRRLVAAEALIRWRHPERGLIPPGEFIPFAESTGFMHTLTHWVVARALDACAAWHAAGFPVRVGVNVTPQDLFDDAFVDHLHQHLEASGLEPTALCLELTETAFMDNPERVVDTMLALRDMGVALAVDDFGTGYSSLTYVRELPVTELKIDRSFTAELAERDEATHIVSSAIELGRRLNMSVVAEGVEDARTLDLLSHMGCNLAQGFHICRPLPEDEFVAWMTARGFVPMKRPVPLVANI